MVFDYHDRTKHHFHRFARSLGHLDWATQPDPFRRYAGARVIPLSREIGGDGSSAPFRFLSDFLRCSLGLSAWKQYGASRWALRVNPSSGNLHPTEGYVVAALPDIPAPSNEGDGERESGPTIFHYAPREHALEERCLLGDGDLGPFAALSTSDAFLVGLTSIHWREAWKYGERAFRYCQHDAGHAIAAVRYAAALSGWQLALLPRWSDADVSALFGLDPMGGDDAGPEREWPDCVAIVTPGDLRPFVDADPAPLVALARHARWIGTPNRLSPSRVTWPIIDEVAKATVFPGVDASTDRRPGALGPPNVGPGVTREVILQRRSAVAFDGRSAVSKPVFVSMLDRLCPCLGSDSTENVTRPPWDAIWWPPHVHLVLFVHRIDGLTPGIYAFIRTGDAAPLRAACREEFLWEPVPNADGLFLLAPLDCRPIARRLSCDQDIAADGFCGMAMLARFEVPLQSHGEWFYRHLFWECGMVGQVLYLEAEAAGARATGIGCYYDDPVHEMLGLSGHTWQSLYHFSMGIPVDDTRLTTEAGYEWEKLRIEE